MEALVTQSPRVESHIIHGTLLPNAICSTWAFFCVLVDRARGGSLNGIAHGVYTSVDSKLKGTFEVASATTCFRSHLLQLLESAGRRSVLSEFLTSGKRKVWTNFERLFIILP